jgi:N-ethylmaleimide reductase
MTRSRSEVDGTPGHLAPDYYAQRAELGLIVTEGTQPSGEGQGYLNTPGIYTDAHVEGWRKVTDAVHEKGGQIFIQLMHVGRMSHEDNTPNHRVAVAPSAIAPGVDMFTAHGFLPISTPRELGTEEISQIVDQFRRAAARAMEAGMDGVEIHGANGYLIHQFLAQNSNQRSDIYGGTLENRARFAIEVAEAIVGEIGAERTGIRLSPGTKIAGIDDGPEGPSLYRHLIAELNKLSIAYVHLLHTGDEPLLRDIRHLWGQALIINRPGRDRDKIGSDVADGLADLEAYGQMVLANPDLLDRLQQDAPLNYADKSAFYGGSEAGYTDYPFLVNSSQSNSLVRHAR